MTTTPEDPAVMAPLCDEPEFADMVADEAPRLFAVVQEYGCRVDGWIAAWGMAFPDHVEVVSVEHHQRMSLSDPAAALRVLSHGGHIRARLVWVGLVEHPAASTIRP